MSALPRATPDAADRRLQTAFKVIVVLATLVAALAAGLVWSWRGRPRFAGNPVLPLTAADNLIQRKFPEVDFGAVYPGLAPAEIDQLQRDCLGLRYVYAPFVEFAPRPVTGRFVNITPAGYRLGRTAAPWPPRADDVTVFVFGGSTTFGFGLPDGQTVVSALEARLAPRFPGRRVVCYNFGRGYYFSAQERALFESLLADGVVPTLAVFIDGLNEFIYHDGTPQLTPELATFLAPDLAAPARSEPTDDRARAAAVDELIARYRRHVGLAAALAQANRVGVIFVGQPVPFLDFSMTPATYPFRSTFAEHRLAGWGYGRFKDAARDGAFGDRFVWCGNALAGADRIMYVDSIHYSAAGADRLAACIVERAAEVGLLP